jgi:hypothetical protein
MKYAFIIGSNAFSVPSNTISYGDEGFGKPFLRVNTVLHETSPADESALSVDLHFKDTDGTQVIVLANKPATGAPYTINAEKDSVKIYRSDKTLILNIHQLDTESAMGLEHNIVAELEVHDPVSVIRITGEFMVDHLHVRAENEKLFINNIGYATSAMVGKNDLRFTSEGVVL